MNKRFLKKTISLMLSIIALVSVASFGMSNASAAEIFPEEQVEAMWAEAADQPVVNDKTDGTACLYSSTTAFGNYPSRKGVILVTDDWYKGLLPTGHAAIVYNVKKVVESLSDGVVMGYNDWYNTKNTCYAVTVSGTTLEEDSEAADWCYEQLGKSYNFNYFNTSTRDKFYCSQLVWAAFYDNFDIDLSTGDFGGAIHPSELVNSERTIMVYRK